MRAYTAATDVRCGEHVTIRTKVLQKMEGRGTKNYCYCVFALTSKCQYRTVEFVDGVWQNHVDTTYKHPSIQLMVLSHREIIIF